MARRLNSPVKPTIELRKSIGNRIWNHNPLNVICHALIKPKDKKQLREAKKTTNINPKVDESNRKIR